MWTLATGIVNCSILEAKEMAEQRQFSILIIRMATLSSCSRYRDSISPQNNGKPVVTQRSQCWSHISGLVRPGTQRTCLNQSHYTVALRAAEQPAMYYGHTTRRRREYADGTRGWLRACASTLRYISYPTDIMYVPFRSPYSAGKWPGICWKQRRVHFLHPPPQPPGLLVACLQCGSCFVCSSGLTVPRGSLRRQLTSWFIYTCSKSCGPQFFQKSISHLENLGARTVT